MLIHDYLEHWALVDPAASCVEDDDRRWTYGDVEAAGNRFAHVLGTLGIRPGDRFAVVAENCLEWFPLYFGAFKAGAVPVPLNYRLNPREWEYIVNDAGAKAVLVQSQYIEAFEQVRAGCPTVERLVVIGDERGEWQSWTTLLDEHPADPVTHRARIEDELYQMYTSGTTGRPKGAILTHAAVDANVHQIAADVPIRKGGRVLVVMPLYHAGAAVLGFCAMASGGSLLVRTAFDPTDCVRALDERGIVSATFVPAMIQAMLVSVPDVRQRKYEDLERIVYGASPIAEETLRQAIDVFGCDFAQAYGMTETSAVLTVLSPDDHRRALEGRPELLLSCGRPVAGTRIRVVDSEDQDVKPGENGELLTRGPQVMKGYWNMPEATAEALRDGWMHTGDAGHLDDEGYLYICDRVKDLIVSGGENIYPREVEDVLFQMPELADAAVIGVPSEKWGEAVKAVVVLRPDQTVTAEAVTAWCRERLAGFKCPKSVDFVDALPRNPSGKVLKTELRKPYWGDRSRNVG